jgi:hypothetical protein
MHSASVQPRRRASHVCRILDVRQHNANMKTSDSPQHRPEGPGARSRLDDLQEAFFRARVLLSSYAALNFILVARLSHWGALRWCCLGLGVLGVGDAFRLTLLAKTRGGDDKPGDTVPKTGEVKRTQHSNTKDKVTIGTKFAPCVHWGEHDRKECTWNTCKPEWLDRRSRPEWFPSSSRERLTRKVLTIALTAWRRSFELGATGEVAVADQQVADTWRQDRRRRGNDSCSILRRPADRRKHGRNYASAATLRSPSPSNSREPRRTASHGAPCSVAFSPVFAGLQWPSRNEPMEPTDLKSNHSARLPGGRMSLDEA